MHEYRTAKMRKCRCMKLLRTIPVAPQGRENGTFLILHSKNGVPILPARKLGTPLLVRSIFCFSLCLSGPHALIQLIDKRLRTS